MVSCFTSGIILVISNLLITCLYCHTPTPFQRQVCRPLHINPQPLPLTTRNSCEAKPYCLLKPCVKFFFLSFSNLGFGKILAAKNLDNMTAAYRIIPNPVYTIFSLFPNMATSNILYISQNYTMYMHMLPLYKFKVYSYKILLITALAQMSG